MGTKVTITNQGATSVAIDSQKRETIRSVGLDSAGAAAKATQAITIAVYAADTANSTLGQSNSIPAFTQANLALSTAQSAFQSANNVAPQVAPAFNTANVALATAQSAFQSANNVAPQVAPAFNTANLALATAQSAFQSANNVAPQVAPAFNQANNANITASAAFNQANLATIIAVAAYNNANSKFSSSGGTITGDVDIVGNLTLSGNTFIIDATRFQVDDPLIYLAANNYTSDIVDIGFIANYVNATGANVHTGLYREHEDKMYYLFQGYDKEPANNHIGALSNNMTLAVLNADIRTSNLILFGSNAQQFIISSFASANAAPGIANSYATAVGTSGNSYTNQVGTSANAYALATATSIGTAGNNYTNSVGTSGNAYALSTATSIGEAGNAYANAVGTAGNTYTLASFTQANTALTTAQGAFAKANSNNGIGNSTSGQVLFNDSGISNGNSTLTFNKTTGTINVSNINVTGTITYITANSVIVGDSEVNSVSLITSSTNDQIIDSFANTSWRSAHYHITMNAGTDYQTTQISILHDGLNAYMTEYATIVNANNLGIFNAVLTSGSIRLNVAPTFSATTIRMFRTTNK